MKGYSILKNLFLTKRYEHITRIEGHKEYAENISYQYRGMLEIAGIFFETGSTTFWALEDYAMQSAIATMYKKEDKYIVYKDGKMTFPWIDDYLEDMKHNHFEL